VSCRCLTAELCLRIKESPTNIGPVKTKTAHKLVICDHLYHLRFASYALVYTHNCTTKSMIHCRWAAPVAIKEETRQKDNPKSLVFRRTIIKHFRAGMICLPLTHLLTFSSTVRGVWVMHISFRQ